MTPRYSMLARFHGVVLQMRHSPLGTLKWVTSLRLCMTAQVVTGTLWMGLGCGRRFLSGAQCNQGYQAHRFRNISVVLQTWWALCS